MSRLEEMKEKYLELVKRIRRYHEAVALLQWDLRTGMPRKGAQSRAELIADLSTEAFRLSTSSEMEGLLQFFDASSEAGEGAFSAMLRESRREFERSRKIPQEDFQAFMVLVSQSEVAWEKARQSADFALFSPFLDRVVSFSRQFADLWREGKGSRYDALLDQYEPGMTTGQLDPMFALLRRELVPFVQEVLDASEAADRSARLIGDYEIERQREANRRLLEQIGYDFSAGRLDESAHPFTVGFNRGDVRVTTHYDRRDLRVSLFSSLHEGGHAIYEQNIAPEFSGTPLWDGASLGVHESQSRFWENVVGRGRDFWEGQYAWLQQLFASALGDCSLEQFYQGINHVSRSLIRVEADELTYNLHIMLRYEVEKGLMDGGIEVRDLPLVWREKMQEYIGVSPENDAEGVLQDVHWSDGSFGYFPTYTLGNIYAAQLTAAMRAQRPSLDAQIRQGNLAPAREWMTQQIHRHGRLLLPQELMRQASGSALDLSCLLVYLKEKYRELYLRG